MTSLPTDPGTHDAALARRVWQAGEVVHILTYFAPETRAATDALGLRGYWMSYFGCRAAPLGTVTAATVTATFYGFSPALVGRAVPDVWTYATPAQLLDARVAAIDTALRRILGDGVKDDPSVRRAAALAGEAAAAVTGAEVTGRPLAAANAALTPPAEPHLALWHALTVLREHRGDGHLALLVGEGIGPVESHVLTVAAGRSSREFLQTSRRWSDDEWAAAVGTLGARGWLDADGAITPAGKEAREKLERDTDRLATTPYRTLGAEPTEELIGLLTPLARAVAKGAGLPFPNPVGVPAP